ncbi:HAD family hydrolase [Metallumcola ferriviriculae]|uniref:HAD family hydrolase n=1 Tax=Metallumcola ferriviriculae TaxID=3039180 RepID=A0AAU0UQ44_9FIRM|nr:HAD family hydrolase [Desulfitibacteraceae bacterium MK1]
MADGAIIFDFDDTLVATNAVFDEAKVRFKQLMVSQGLDMPNLLDVVNRFDIDMVTKYGFVNECFPKALVQVYRYCSKNKRAGICESMEKEVEQVGWWVFRQAPIVKEGSRETLTLLREDYHMILVTKGEKAHQIEKLKESGLEHYFQSVLVVGKKDPYLFTELAQSNAFPLDKVWSVGNSIKSDINPALRAGLNAVLLKAPTWDFEHETPLLPVPEIEEISQLPGILSQASLHSAGHTAP